ncbi:YihY/virulence factor BrkB family protein [Deminuibacter soli]|uniref:YihY/virulence factor BrkB family protein n=1 Tax=Deminuibacter soli TaxID=2291815 RepID=UPI0013150234|nr:YihY/virulence factor BrkB family protein [Deminuibacter soli]
MTKLERVILNSAPASFFINKSRRIILPGFEGLALYDVVQYFLNQVKRVGLNVRAAAISFNFIMAIPAAAIFLFTLVPYLPISKQFHNELFRIVRDITPNQETQKFMVSFLDDIFNKPKGGMLSLGFILAVFYSSNAMMGIIRTFDRSLVYRRRSNFVAKRWRAIRLTTIVILLIIGTILISLGQGVLFKSILGYWGIHNSSIRFWIKTLRWLVILVLFLVSIGLIYKYAPSVTKRWRILSPGAIFAASVTILVTMLFSIWVTNFSNYNKFYGSIGTVLILMFLIFINSLILLVGFELNVSISHLKKERDEQNSLKEMD